MSSEEEKLKHSQRRKRNLIAKDLKENKLYRQKTISGKKPKIYEKFNKKTLEKEFD